MRIIHSIGLNTGEPVVEIIAETDADREKIAEMVLDGEIPDPVTGEYVRNKEDVKRDEN